MMISATHGDTRWTDDERDSAEVTSSLSAVVSRNAPSRVVTPQRRARRPSNQSVAAATTNTIAAASYEPPSTSAITAGQSRTLSPVPAASILDERNVLNVPASTGG